VSVVVVATIVALPEHVAEVRAAIQESLADVHAEPGCELYSLQEDSDGFVMIEKWSSPEDLARHGTGAALRAMRARLAGKVGKGGGMRVLTQVEGGEPTKGAL
jgi:quinol monooxygenase YgiN